MKIRTLPIYVLQFHQERLENGPDDREYYSPDEITLWERWHRRAISALQRAKRTGGDVPDFLTITVKEKHNDA